jgi:ABC-type uncharacterized transport system substrate-binding protein
MIKKQLNTLLSTVVLCLLFVTSATSSAAGFHYQLNLTARLAMTPAGELSGIEMSWLYDSELSATLMDGEDLSEENRAATLNRRAADILNGLFEMKYFTNIHLDNQPLSTLRVEQYNLQLTESSQLQLNLTLPLAEAKSLQGHQLQIVVSDPTAVGLATFLTADRLLLSDYQQSICKQPTLQQNQLGTEGDHILMSETMTVDCR